MKTNRITIGILAHVDAGKTTLSESILFHTGHIKKLGRVDHGNAFLDTDPMERDRGITIFSKQAVFQLEDKLVTLMDTPGHVDFSAEMERTLQVLDYAVLVINGADGVQSHTLTLWKLLGCYGVPVFLFINKMDQPGTDSRQLLVQLQKRLDSRCLDLTGAEGEGAKEFTENLAMCSEGLMEEYLDKGVLTEEHIGQAIRERSLFPCYFGSALKGFGVKEFLEGLGRYSRCPDYGRVFAARVYKITRDGQGNRLTHMKITGGSLRVKDVLTNGGAGGGHETASGEEAWQEKADQLRIYSGNQFQVVGEAGPGTICAVLGLSRTRAGQGLGAEPAGENPILEPVLNYQILLPQGCDPHGMMRKLRQLEEEEPQLHISWNEETGEIHGQLMGEIEIEILKKLILDRFDTEVEFGTGTIVYKETIAEPVEGAGHFEPLRHYAEVHLLLEPGDPGSGLHFSTRCSEDLLSRNWQRLILTHLEEKKHRGVLTGSEITDMKITLTAGKGHLKHTEGGDFRQATYRAVRQGLRKAKSVLLEPVYQFRLEVPTPSVGRALADVQKMGGSFGPPETDGEISILAGTAPVAAMSGYQGQLTAYTKGLGRLFCTLKGYEPCADTERVIKEIGYDPDQDLENPCGSVFCSHGTGFLVSWQEADSRMDVDSGLHIGRGEDREDSDGGDGGLGKAVNPPGDKERPGTLTLTWAEEKELEAIFLRTYGKAKGEQEQQPKRYRTPVHRPEPEAPVRYRKPQRGDNPEHYLLVDGYNIIFDWEDLKELAKTNLEAARVSLIEKLCNYQGYKKDTVIVVFDAYRVEGGRGAEETYGGVHVIYTKEAETADQYIEKVVNRLGRTHDVTVATSDNLVQMIIWGEGARRLSAQGLKEEVQRGEAEIRKSFEKYNTKLKNYPFRTLISNGQPNRESGRPEDK